ncbi:hypothetical protein [Clostridium sp. LCP25S3_F10]|jgi:hypothetical protein|uniref:hypothetical protein n=1 Tax=Clostridium sp. LCP25S3_F10 TaxID=3438750 RepID=UPI003F93AF96
MLKFGFQIYDSKKKNKIKKASVFKTGEERNDIIKYYDKVGHSNVNNVNKIMKWLNPNSKLLQYIMYNFNEINTTKFYRLCD